MIKIYTIGAISCDPNWREKFRAVKEKWEAKGFKILSPLDHPAGLTYDEYMQRSIQYVFECDGMIQLPDWRDSPGAVAETGLCQALNSSVECRQRPYIEDGSIYEKTFIEHFMGVIA